jgi:hypothetical protein
VPTQIAEAWLWIGLVVLCLVPLVIYLVAVVRGWINGWTIPEPSDQSAAPPSFLRDEQSTAWSSRARFSADRCELYRLRKLAASSQAAFAAAG